MVALAGLSCLGVTGHIIIGGLGDLGVETHCAFETIGGKASYGFLFAAILGLMHVSAGSAGLSARNKQTVSRHMTTHECK